jgi:hypothetical protein
MNQPRVIGFKGFINRYFPVDFKIPNWHLIDYDDPLKETADVFFQVNIKKRKTKAAPEYDYISNAGKPTLVCESNLFRTNVESTLGSTATTYKRLGWNHFLRQGNFNNENSPPDRWNKIKDIQQLEVKDWKTKKQRGDSILLILQKGGDSTLNKMYEDYGTYYNWIEETITNIRKYTDRPIIIRPHVHKAKVPFKQFVSEENKVSISEVFEDRTRYEGGKSLEHDFKKTWAVVGYTSNTMVESTLEGIPTFPLSDESVVWDISNQNKLENIENPEVDIQRDQWCYDAGYMLWTVDEINNGVAWNHLKKVYF